MNQINLTALEDFLEYGILAPGDDFSRALSQLRIHPRAVSTDFDLSFETAIDRSFECFQTSLQDQLENFPLKSFALSGGLDTRLILASLLTFYPSRLKDLRIYTRIHPCLSKNSDRDSIVVAQLQHRFSFNVEYEIRPEVHPQAYLAQTNNNDGLNLCGLFGGEFLGGQIFNILPFDPRDVFLGRESSHLKHFLDVSNRKSSANLNLLHLIDLVANTNASAIYNALTWFVPSRFLKSSRSPFYSEKFFTLFEQVPDKYFRNYRLYVRMMEKYFPSFLSVPVNNPLLQIFPSITLASVGREAKNEDPPLSWVNSAQNHELGEFDLSLLCQVDQLSNRKYASFLKSAISRGLCSKYG